MPTIETVSVPLPAGNTLGLGNTLDLAVNGSQRHASTVVAPPANSFGSYNIDGLAPQDRGRAYQAGYAAYVNLANSTNPELAGQRERAAWIVKGANGDQEAQQRLGM